MEALLIALVILASVGFVPQLDAVWGIAGGLALVGFLQEFARLHHSDAWRSLNGYGAHSPTGKRRR